MAAREDTRSELLRAARSLFAERGYAAVGTEEVVQAAGVTRGALYHHFRDKRDLFQGVLEQVEADIVAAVGRAVEGVEDARELLLRGTRAYLDACTEPAFMQIALLDGPAVLGWQALREIDARHGLGLVSLVLEGAMAAGLVPRQELRPLAHLMLAALSEAAFLVAHAGDQAQAREEVESALLALVGVES